MALPPSQRLPALLALLALAWGPCPGGVLVEARKALPRHAAAVRPCCACAEHARGERAPADRRGDDDCPCCVEPSVRGQAIVAVAVPALPPPITAGTALPELPAPVERLLAPADVLARAHGPPPAAPVGVIVLVV